MTQVTNLITSLVLIISTLCLTSCDREAIMEAISESEAAEIIEAELQEQAGGLSSNLEDIAEELVEAILSGELCDTLYTDSLANDYQSPKLQASYHSTYSYQLACNNFNLPESATFTSATLALFNTARIDADHDAIFSGVASGLQILADTVLINGSYSRSGSQELNANQQREINSTLTADLMDCKINKQGYELEAGTANITLSGATPDESFSFSGTIVFHGNQTATFSIDGMDYSLDWN